jgi:NDP-sugar pyrophosphorylase family protein
MSYKIDYSPKVPYSDFKKKLLVDDTPLPKNDQVGIYYDTYYECYVQSISENEAYFYYNHHWVREPLSNLIQKRIEKLDGMINITQLKNSMENKNESK